MSPDAAIVQISVKPLPRGRDADPRFQEERRIPLRICADGKLRSDALFAVRYVEAGRVYRRALVLDPRNAVSPLSVTDGLFPPFRDCHPELLGWVSRVELGSPLGLPSDADQQNDDPDYVHIQAHPLVEDDPRTLVEPRVVVTDLGGIARWGTRCRRCGALDSAIRYTADGGIFRVRAEGAGELRSDTPAAGFPPLAVATDAYHCVGCDSTITGSVADDLFETLPVDDGESERLINIVGALKPHDRWEVEGFEQEATERGVAFSGRLKRQGRLVAWFEHRGDGGSMEFGALPEARANGDADYLHGEIRRLTGSGAFEPEEPFVLAVLEQLGL